LQGKHSTPDAPPDPIERGPAARIRGTAWGIDQLTFLAKKCIVRTKK
jgi:hypothetical protein